jgi:hypothetical protein
MKLKNILLIIFLFAIPYLSWSGSATSDFQDVDQLVAKSPQKGWWHKTFNAMDGNRYLLSFDSQKHPGQLNWKTEDIQDGKIPIAKAMQLAKEWCDKNKPFGDSLWEIDTVNLRMRSKDTQIEFIYIVTLKTKEYKTIDIVVLPSHELIAPELNPKLVSHD